MLVSFTRISTPPNMEYKELNDNVRDPVSIRGMSLYLFAKIQSTPLSEFRTLINISEVLRKHMVLRI